MAILKIPNEADTGNDLIRVNSLHALLYCPRLFYLEEVEGQYTQDDAVFAGRRLHRELEKSSDCEWETLSLESTELGLRGRVDAVVTRHGHYTPYEHKRGHCCRNYDGSPGVWPSDRIQVLAYGLLLEKTRGCAVSECKIRYHADNVTVSIPFDEQGRQDVLAAINMARKLRESIERPPVTDNEKLCVRCSLAPICLPEEVRLTRMQELERVAEHPPTLRLFPPDEDRKVVHVVEQGARISRSGDQLKIEYKQNEKPPVCLPVNDVGQLVIHGYSQVSTQAMRLCIEEDVGIHYLTGSGRYLGSIQSAQRTRVQQKIRQFQALLDPSLCLRLAKQLVDCRADMQRQILMRGIRRGEENLHLAKIAKQMKILQAMATRSTDINSLRGFEGSIGALYFAAFGTLISKELPAELSFSHRNRRPPKDRINALLSYGYGVLLKDVVQALNVVGLESGFGFFHRPRSSAPPLALDLMEIFRVLLVDIPVLNSVNRQQWDPGSDFVATKHQVWLSDDGKKKLIGVYERRKSDTWKHPVIGYSLSYGRILELEARLLEKEWMNEGGLFARLRLR